MQMSKKILLVFLISFLICIIGFTTCLTTTYFKFYYYLETRVDSQENTIWQSEDGKIIIHIGEDHNKIVSFEQDDNHVDCYFTSGRNYYAKVYALEALENNRLGLNPEEHYETWVYKKVEKDCFTITVEKTKFLEVGDEITFHRTQG